MNKLMFKGRILMLMMLTVLAATSCDDDDDIDIDPNRLTKESFMQQAAASDMFEIQTGQMAADEAEMQAVRDFGQLLVTHHTMNSNNLMQLAANEGVTLPTTLPQDKKAMRDELAGLEGETFDRRFVEMQIAAHEEAIALYEEAIDDVEDPEVVAFAQDALPLLRSHLAVAQQLDQMME
ncbi:DUF4142 domain-containing protein [Pontibacter rugosus]|uniref:DUF4142 domain-containing protein n=1 Tax=Pontibacter rugosus TaxID=1745966 RepID=A0ABW3SRS6_9BACT